MTLNYIKQLPVLAFGTEQITIVNSREFKSFMTEGQAEAWADQFVEEAWTQQPGPDLNLGTYEEFQKTLKAMFSAYNSPGNALNEIQWWHRQTYYDVCHPSVWITPW